MSIRYGRSYCCFKPLDQNSSKQPACLHSKFVCLHPITSIVFVPVLVRAPCRPQ